MKKGQVKAALRAARQLALLTRDAAGTEAHRFRFQHYRWKGQVQEQARQVERLTAALGVTDGGNND